MQLEVATHPRLVKFLQVPIRNVLDEALSSHRYALGLNPKNVDTLFNTAQILTTIAEELAEDAQSSDSKILALLEEALELQSRCLSLQELKFEENETQQRTLQEQIEYGQSDDTVDMDEVASSNDSEKWFSVVEPVTRETLLETVLAQLSTLTALCSTISSMDPPPANPSLASIENYSRPLIDSKIPHFASLANESRLQEIALVKANLATNLLEAGFRQGELDTETYKRERDAAFQIPDLKLAESYQGLLANGQSLMSFATALADAPGDNGVPLPSVQWNALSAAISNFATASKLPQVEPNEQAKTHFLRGDCSLLLFQLGQPPISYDQAVKNAPQLLKNAEVFYRNASKLGDDSEQRLVASLRSSVAQRMDKPLDGTTLVSSLGYLGKPHDWIRQQLDDMVEDGLLSLSATR